MLFGLEFVADRRTKEPFAQEANVGVRVREAARKRGLLLRASHSMAVLAPPLTTTADELDEMIGIIEAVLAEVLVPLETASPLVNA